MLNKRDKLIQDIALIEDPYYITGWCDDDVCCHFCDNSILNGIDEIFIHEDNCIWKRAKEIEIDVE